MGSTSLAWRRMHDERNHAAPPPVQGRRAMACTEGQHGTMQSPAADRGSRELDCLFIARLTLCDSRADSHLYIY